MPQKRFKPRHNITLSSDAHQKGLELCHKLNLSFSGTIEKLITDAHRALIQK